MLCLLAACGSRYATGPSGGYRGNYAQPTHYYPPPGPPSDPWGPYIREAATRFGLPDQWIRAVMRQESGGREQVVSSAGAMGLMQLMPATYESLRKRYGLGSDPFEPHDNIAAGTAYLREMYDRFGAPGFLAAYNAGPNRLDNYLSGGGSLPDETVNYVASIAPRLGNTGVMTGPLAVYAQGGGPVQYAGPPVTTASGACDPDAAYNPDRTCAPMAAPVAAPVVTASSGACDPDAAYDPSNRCQRSIVATIVPVSAPIASQPLQSPPPVATAPVSGSDWAIQVGAFAAPIRARLVALGARDAMVDLLGAAQVELLPTSPLGGAVIYRARLSNLSANAASAACARLSAQQQPCMVIPPGQSL